MSFGNRIQFVIVDANLETLLFSGTNTMSTTHSVYAGSVMFSANTISIPGYSTAPVFVRCNMGRSVMVLCLGSKV